VIMWSPILECSMSWDVSASRRNCRAGQRVRLPTWVGIMISGGDGHGAT
jgi:hypothetical protein